MEYMTFLTLLMLGILCILVGRIGRMVEKKLLNTTKTPKRRDE